MARREVEEVEQIPYEVIGPVGAIEIRHYGPWLGTEADLGTGTGVEAGQSSAFQALAEYIFASNRQAPSVAMTAPVVMELAPIAMTAPVAMERSKERRVMRFFMPSIYTAEALPKPGDDRVRIVTVPAQTLAVLRFTGELTDTAVAERQAELLATLEGSDWRPAGEPGVFGYDAPGVPPEIQRHEVYVAVAATDSHKGALATHHDG